MSWPDEPCPACPRRDLGGCRAQQLRNATLCEHAANGHEGYRSMLARPPEDRQASAPAASLPLAGDLLAMVLRWVGVAWLVGRWTEGTCRCASRQERLNRLDARLRRWLGMG